MKGYGANYGDVHKSAHGEKGSSGYANNDAFSKGLRGLHARDHQKGHYDINGGRKIGNRDEANQYSSEHQAGKAHRGGSFAQEKSHDKGSKTTGYHKVFHKDEYKKDHTFYDKADQRGFFNKYGDFEAKKVANEGASKKGAHHDSGFKEIQHGAKGESDKGRFIGENEGYKGAKGFERFFKNYQDFAEKGGKSSGSEEGYAKGDKLDIV